MNLLKIKNKIKIIKELQFKITSRITMENLIFRYKKKKCMIKMKIKMEIRKNKMRN